ncbi:MaoC family dehydratase [Vibrio vulnificus]|jgi:acyl dehydratase|uniref:MaoC family dehydratase n=2 Tax=Vibrio TaxID=662 RepID=A0AAW4H7R5_VIBVL|nr:MULTISPECIES: MaoC family dehydratase [Vibrio]OJI54035.1 putative enoyl-CoA hydratase 1 [Vibrio fluvialis]ASM98833.1 dehydratase [Vibrio vulnificus NBRC 15645 = ATCC 27562]AUL98017.1 Acyl dehydratase [Vibrio vulnificus]AVX02485.1 dehydratase [Vibrio vulnificus Env1]EGQ7692157.1 MaoC family dehydratase [Vibrio vulnificus]
MKVTNLFKDKVDAFSAHHSEFINWMSPTLREYWGDFLGKAQGSFLFSKVRDHQQPAVNEEVSLPEPIVLKPEAQLVYNELSEKIGQVIHVGDWIHVDQERINQFGLVTEDMQWIHTDPERAAVESPFKTTIAHGFLTLALLPKLTDSVNPDNNLFPTAKMVVNIGLNQVRFPYPVKSGNNLRASSTLTKVTPIKKGLEIEREIKVEIEGVRRPAAVVVSVIQLHF